jgi:hypothetical protein
MKDNQPQDGPALIEVGKKKYQETLAHFGNDEAT